jgi:hypothetical protein
VVISTGSENKDVVGMGVWDTKGAPFLIVGIGAKVGTGGTVTYFEISGVGIWVGIGVGWITDTVMLRT